jgi:signal transduction histidine kinase
VNNMLDLAKLQSGRMESAGVRFDLRDVVDECAAMTRLLVRGRPITVRAEVSDEVAEIQGDPGKVRQILVNLMGNAAKFVESGEIAVRGWREGDAVKLAVHDTGPGIPAEAQRRIFDAFRQADQSATRKHSGTGLGLTISVRLAELLGGTIRLESKVGEGSTFTLELPLKR